MKIRGICEACHKMKWFIRKRTYKHKHIGRVTSQDLLCGKCADTVVKMLGKDLT